MTFPITIRHVAETYRRTEKYGRRWMTADGVVYPD